MVTRRDAFMAIAAASMAAPAVWAAQDAAPKKLPSSVFDWTKLKMEPTKVGERRAVFDSPTGTLDRLECHATTINPGEEPHAPHKHPEEEMIIIKEGTVEIMQNDVKTVAGAGSVIFH